MESFTCTFFIPASTAGNASYAAVTVAAATPAPEKASSPTATAPGTLLFFGWYVPVGSNLYGILLKKTLFFYFFYFGMKKFFNILI